MAIVGESELKAEQLAKGKQFRVSIPVGLRLEDGHQKGAGILVPARIVRF